MNPSIFLRLQRIEDRTVSRRSKPSSRTSLIGEQPNPWDLLQPQDEMSGGPAWKGHRSTDKRYAGDNRLISPKSSYRRGGLAPRCRLIASWGCRRSQGFGCSPIKAARELLSLRYLLSVERRQFHIQPPDHLGLLSYLLDLWVSQLGGFVPISGG